MVIQQQHDELVDDRTPKKNTLTSTQKLNLSSTKNFVKPVPIIEEVTKENFFTK